jgi:hypothetical protein
MYIVDVNDLFRVPELNKIEAKVGEEEGGAKGRIVGGSTEGGNWDDVERE